MAMEDMNMMAGGPGAMQGPMPAEGQGEESTEGLDMFDVPVPGESLTSDPDTRRPYEQPPEFTDVEDAVRDIFMRVTEPETLDDTLDMMREGIAVEDIAQVYLFGGFQQGKYTPDLMLLLAEPIIYILLSLADYAQIDPVIYPEEDMDEDEEDFEESDEALNAVEMALMKYRSGEKSVSTKESTGQDVVSVAGLEVARPRSVAPSLLEVARSRVQELGGEE